MHVTSHRRLLATPAAIHLYLSRDISLRTCLPDCDSFSGALEPGYDFALTRRIGMFGITFNGRITFSQIEPGVGYVLDVAGSSAVTGSLAAQLKLVLTPRARATLLDAEATFDPPTRMAVLGRDRIAQGFTHGVGNLLDRMKSALEAAPADHGPH